MTQENILISESVLRRFALLVKNNALAHAYLFTGPVATGKSETALAVAKLVNCEAALPSDSALPCEACSSCLKIKKGNHPDVRVIAKGDDAQDIKIEQIRELNLGIQLRPFEAKKKIFILNNIEDITPEASNALLKTLEEPAGESLLLLTTSFLDRVLDTVKSRCHAVPFFSLSPAMLEGILTKDYHMDRTAAHYLARFSEGSLGKAVKFKEDGLREKNMIIDNFILVSNSERYIQDIVGNRDEVAKVLHILFSWFRDLILIKSGIDELKLIHVDRAADLRKLHTKYSFVDLEEGLTEIIMASQSLEDNLNLKIALTLMKERLWRK